MGDEFLLFWMFSNQSILPLRMTLAAETAPWAGERVKKIIAL